MATAITHALVALALGKSITRKPMPFRFWMAGVVCSIIPDADVLGFGRGIEYGDLWDIVA
jgi:inner membrane protein